MGTFTKLGVAAFLVGAAIVPALNANAANHTADFTLVVQPVSMTVESTYDVTIASASVAGSSDD